MEARLRTEIEKRGGMAIKLMSQLHRGLPDRMVMLPGGRIVFVELKTTGKKPTGLQEHCHRQLRALGFSVYIVDSSQSLTDLLWVLDAEATERINTGLR